MKKICLITALALLASVCAKAQDIDSPGAAVPSATVDSVYLGRDIFEVMPSRLKGDPAGVSIRQDPSVRSALRERVNESTIGQMSGYRVRIYFSNAQNARSASSAAAARFAENFPGYAVYRSYVNPNFKVTVGDFRTKSEALRLRETVKGMFPAAFIVKENIKD